MIRRSFQHKRLLNNADVTTVVKTVFFYMQTPKLIKIIYYKLVS